MRRALHTATVALALLCAMVATAHAQSGSPFGEDSRAAALVDAVTGRHGDLSSLTLNPAGLADIEYPSLSLNAQLADVSTWYARTDEPRQTDQRAVSGFGFALGAPLPGPEALQRLHIGLGVWLPVRHVLLLRADFRDDVPSSPVYADRVEHASVAIGAAYNFFDRVSLGVSLMITPSLSTPITTAYVPGRGEVVDENVAVTLSRSLPLAASPIVGVRVTATDWLSLGLAYRTEQAVDAYGDLFVEAGSVIIEQDIEVLLYWNPPELAGGFELLPHSDLSWSVDAVWSRWSQYRALDGRAPRPGFDDVVNVRTGVEWQPATGYRLRAGYGYEPSPVPEQVSDDNFIDANRHALGFGFGVDFGELEMTGISIDAHFRAHLMGEVSNTKDLDALSDGDLRQPGFQLVNAGYPGFDASGHMVQGGITITFRLNRELR